MVDKGISLSRQVASARPPWQHCAVILALCLASYFLLPNHLAMMSRIAIMALFVLSLDLVVGYAGLATLGHVAFFGVGAYAAGIVALRLTADPLTGLALGGLAGAVAAGISGLLVLRYQGFTFLMLTVAVAQILQNLANKLRGLTGGDDGLSGFTMNPVLGMASFDMEGRVAFLYTSAVLVLSYFVIKRLVDSPFGLSVLGIHQCRARMAAIGTDVPRQLWKIYAIAGFFAGVAGALSAQTSAIVGLDSLGFTLSAEALVMLILGGAGRLYGALLGAVIFMVMHHTASSINPYHWLFVIGGLLMIVVILPRESLRQHFLAGWLSRLFARPVKTGDVG